MFVEHLGHGARLDRVYWDGGQFTESTIDAHALRPGFTSDNWPRVVDKLLRHIMPAEALQWATQYRDRFVQEVRGGDDTKGSLVDGMGRTER